MMCISIRTLYTDKTLPVAVRVNLIDLLTSLYAVDRDNAWTSLTLKKKKRSSSQAPGVVSVKQALVMMVNDSDHVVRMHVATAITSLYVAATVGGAQATTPSTSHDRLVLLSCAGQEETFERVLETLQLVFVISEDLDELSTEDESVNRVASRIYTLLLEGCVSPVCEHKVVGELVKAVGHGYIDADLVTKVNMY